MTLLVLKHLSSEDERSPEFRFLLSVTLARTREVFDTSEVRTWRDVGGVGAPDAETTDARALDAVSDRHDAVLVLGRENLWFTADTLRDMRTALANDAGAIVIPSRLTDFALDDLEPLYTPRDYERLERSIRDERRQPRTSTVSHLPMSLLSADAFRTIASRVPISRLLTDAALLSTPRHDAGLRIITDVGLYHQFADYYGETRADLLPYLPATAEAVLEIGCGRGHTGRLIQERLGCRVTGIERHPEVAAEAATRLWRVLAGDVATLPIDGRYDAIVASELFEHLDAPDDFLLRMKPLLAPGGRIVLSVPNVGHYTIVEDLLAGRWDYVPAGLLCYTHLRFFTRQTLEEWAFRLGFTCEIVPQLTELPERFRRLADSLSGNLSGSLSSSVDVESLRTRGFYVVLRDAHSTAASSSGSTR